MRMAGHAAAVLGKASFCVLPSTIHPQPPNNPYTWLGIPLHERDLSALPLIENDLVKCPQSLNPLARVVGRRRPSGFASEPSGSVASGRYRKHDDLINL